jgi:hypothetical protein
MHLKNIVLLLVVCGLYNTAAATQAKLVINNLAPRVGDEISISVVFSTPATENTDNYNFATNYFVKSELKINQAVTKAGSIWVGPFTFKIDGEVLTTDSISIEVAEALPVQNNQVIVREITYQQKQYLVVEQLTPTIKNDKTKYVELKLKTLEKLGLSLKEKLSSTSSSTKGDSNISFSQTIYEIKKDENFVGPFTITPNSFDNFPANASFQNFNIK